MPAGAWVAFASLCVVVVINVAVCAFMLGRLSQRVATLERDGSVLQELRDAVTRLTTQMEGVLPDLAHLSRDMASIQRALSNLTTDRASRLVELPATRGRRKPE